MAGEAGQGVVLPWTFRRMLLALMVLQGVVMLACAQEEIDECKAWLNSSAAATSIPITPAPIVPAYSSCTEFRTAELVKKSGVAQVTMLSVDGNIRRRSSPLIKINFLGFSFEYSSTEEMVPNGTPNPAVVRLFRNLAKFDHKLNIHVGGNSAMLVRLKTSKLPPYQASRIVMEDSSFIQLRKLALATNAKLTMALPMLTTDTRYGIEFALQGILKNIDPKYLHSLEFGNEPDHWQMDKKCFRASPNFNFNSYMIEYNQLAADLSAAWPKNKARVPYQGPAIAGCNTFPPGQLPCWQADLPNFSSSTDANTKYVSYHRYGNSGCSKQSNLRTLMNDPQPGHDTKSYDWLDRVMSSVAPGKEVLWSEGNAFSCGGNECLSKSFAVTLWALDNTFEVALRGVGGAYMHAVPGHIYTPFNPVGKTQVEVMPVYYASMAFSDMLTTRSSVVFQPSISTTSPLIKAWGIDHGNGRMHYCLIHKDPDQTQPLTVMFNALGASTAKLTYLTAPDAFSTDITYRGQKVGSNGMLSGQKVEYQLIAVDGRFIFQVHPITIAMVEF